MKSRNEQIDFYLRQYMVQSNVTGLAIALAQQGEILYAAGYGVQDQRTGQPVTPDTLFHIASVATDRAAYTLFSCR
jgi:CubicO group peptidase (beta-lactamase class C family)